jgi:nitrogen fixation/metabolism regulation signal transduction histidine kinase
MIQKYIARSISAKLNFPFAVVFIFVLVGLVLFANTSRFTAQQMEGLHEQTEHIQKINQMHAATYHLILSAHHFLLTKEVQFIAVFNNHLDELSQQASEYIELEEGKTYPQAEKEIALVEDIKKGVRRLKVHSVELFKRFSSKGTIDATLMQNLESEAYTIEFQITKINNLHGEIIDSLAKVSASRVRFLVRLYLIYILLGAILLIIVNMIATRYVVGPVKKLAKATEALAHGDLRRRVDLDSDDEVGALARSFNEMAERLEAHDREHHDFSMELERKVRERTRELEQTTAHLKATQAHLIRTERQAAVGRLAAGVAHEIRTPLNSLAINLQLVRHQLQEIKEFNDSSIPEAFSTVDLEVSRMNRVLEEFVAYARFPEPKFKTTDLNSLVGQVADYLAPEASENEAFFEKNLSPDVPAIVADAEQLRQVLINLYMNAVQAMPNGGTITLETDMVYSVEEAVPVVLIRVRDEGEGIPAEASPPRT